MSTSAFPPGHGPRRSLRGIVVGAALALAGLLVVVAGTFLPWLTSGGVQRNSYSVLGIVRRLGFVQQGPAAVAVSLWPSVGAVAMVPVVAGILRWWRSAAIATLLFGLLTGLGAALVLAVAGGHRAAGISLSQTGPVVTVIGAGIAVVGAVLLMMAARRSRRAQLTTSSNRYLSAELQHGPLRPTAQSATFVGFDGSTRRPLHSPQEPADSTSAVETERESA